MGGKGAAADDKRKDADIRSAVQAFMPKIKQGGWARRVGSDFDRGSEGGASASSGGPQRADDDLDERSDPGTGEFLAGDDALIATSDLLLQRLRADARLQEWLTSADVPRLASQVQRLLGGVFEGADWPALRVAPSLVDAHFEGLVGALLDAMRQPLPLGEDVLVFAIKSVHGELRHDVRVQQFLEHIRNAAHPPLEEDDDNTHGHSLNRKESPRSEPELPLTNAAGAQPKVTVRDRIGSVSRNGMASANGAESKTASSVSVAKFEELRLEPDMIREIQNSWANFCATAQSPEIAGDMLYGAFFEGARNLQTFFRMPRVMQSAKLVGSLNSFVLALDDPAELDALVECLAFMHLHLEVAEIHVVTLRDAILTVFEGELADGFTTAAQEGWKKLLDYLGGVLIFKKKQYADHLNILQTSWQHVKDKGARAKTAVAGKHRKARHSSAGRVDSSAVGTHEDRGVGEEAQESPATIEDGERGEGSRNGTNHKNNNASGAQKHSRTLMGRTLPTTFEEMFEFNAAMMGLSNCRWLQETLALFDNIVTHIANPVRVGEECEILVLRISKCANSKVDTAVFQKCMLAALRSMLPKAWDSSHEVAWSWMWENVERVLHKCLYGPPIWEKSLANLMSGLGEDQKYAVRQAVFVNFFQRAPAGQDYFKQSNTRLNFITTRIMEMTLELYHEPWRVVEEISALGLRHVGYGIPTELFGPFVTAYVEELSPAVGGDARALESFRWSICLIAKILMRTIAEGSTIVMRAINENSPHMLQRAISAAPRKFRAEYLLNVQVGTQQISPLSWAIESGSFEVANAIIKDLFTIRADREKYYYGVDEVFRRHRDIIERLCKDAPTLLPTLLEGLVWRSRHTKNAMRRVNYYVKHLVIGEDGGLSSALRALAASKDQTIISHPVIVLVSDTLWTGVVRRQFFLSKVGFLFSLIVFMVSQALLPKTNDEGTLAMRIVIFSGRLVNYLFSMMRLLVFHGTRLWLGYYHRDTARMCGLTIPKYLHDPYNALSFVLMILLAGMCAHEPMFYCHNSNNSFPTEICDNAANVEFQYTILSMCAMVFHWVLLVNLSVFSTKMAAFVLVCHHVFSEVGRFLVAMLFLLATFSSAITCLRHDKEEFFDITSSANCLFAITVGLYEGDYRELNHEPVLTIAVFIFVTASAILLINLLIAQLNCSYDYVYQDMVGFARLTRAELIVDALASCPLVRWTRFVSTLRLDQPSEFDEGDIGLPGCIQVKEPASLNPCVTDSIHRYGGTSSPDLPWPETHEDEDGFDRIERLMQSALEQIENKGRTQHDSSEMTGLDLSRSSNDSRAG